MSHALVPSLSRRVLTAAAVSLLAVFASPAAAQDGVRVAQACVEQMETTTKATVEKQNDVTRRGVVAIRQAGRDDAPNRVIRSIAETTRERVVLNGARGKSAVEDLATACIHQLRRIGVDDRVIQAVRQATRASLERIDTSTERSLRVIRAAVERATS